VRDGLLPNLFPEGDREALYHTVDATLWYFHAIERYVSRTGDTTLLAELYPVLQGIIEHHLRGTRFGIGVDTRDGLVHAAAEDLPLTWMDAKVDGWVVTPRRGKPVEVQALWYNALRLMAAWGRALNDAAASRLDALADRVQASFNARYWSAPRGHLLDVVDGPGGDDASLRPNQIFALSLTHPVLHAGHWAAVLSCVERHLLTPFGLRTLGPGEPGYQRRYAGNLRERDAAYHQGTVWPWLLGHFVDAWLRVHGGGPRARALLAALPAHIGAYGLGSIAEVFDAEAPHRAGGCIAQAWSVAETLRAWQATRDPQ
jgi:predicted glycogen debranching enzyme